MLLGDASSDFPLNWAVLFPVVMGFLAVWYLLPTPRRRPLVNGVFGVVVAILGFGVFLFHGLGGDLPFTAEVFLFGSFALMALTFGMLMIAQRNPARAALFFAVVVLSVCGLFLLLAAPFLMAATIIIYAGAIIVTFLFVIMLAQQSGQSDANDRTREPSLAAAVGFVILGTLLVVLQRVYVTSELDNLVQISERYAKAEAVDSELKKPAGAKRFLTDVVRVRERYGYGKIPIPNSLDGVEKRKQGSDAVEELKEALGMNLPSDLVAPPGHEFEPSPAQVKEASAQIHYELSYLKAVRDGRIAPSIPGLTRSGFGDGDRRSVPVDPAKATPRRLPNANIAALGRTLFADHLIAIELGGTLLLVATIGAIAIAGNRSEKAA